MEGLRRGNRVGQINLSNLRTRSSTFMAGVGASALFHSSGTRNADRTEALAGRLQELLILELGKDGSRRYLNVSVRGLYRHVITCITNPRLAGGKTPDDASAGETNTKILRKGSRKMRVSMKENPSGMIGQAMAYPLPLGMAPVDPSAPPDDPSQSLLGSTPMQQLPEDHDFEPREPIPFPISQQDTFQPPPRAENVPNEAPSSTNTISENIPPPPQPAVSSRTLSPPTMSRLKSVRGHARNVSIGAVPPSLNPPGYDKLNPRAPDTATAQQQGNVTYRERLGGYLHPRDMRRLVTPFSASNEPELIVRRHVMLLNFDPLRAIILRDRLLVLVPDGADSLLVDLEERVRGGSAEVDLGAWLEGEMDETENEDNDRSANESGNEGKNATSNEGSDAAMSQSNSSSKKKGFLSNFLPPGELFNKSRARSSNKTSKNQPSDSDKEDRFSEVTSEDDESDSDDEWDELERREWIDLPFELQCVDAVLFVVGSMLTEDTENMHALSMECIQKLLTQSGGLYDDPLTVIRSIKDTIRELTARVKGFVQSLNRILDEDEDMALMNLSRLLTHPERFIQPVPQEVLEEESDEPELILEANLQIALTLTNSLDLMKGQIETASELVDQKLDAMRNRLLFANMVISVFSLCVGGGAFIGSIFGMNLTNHLEDDPNAFSRVTISTVFGSLAMGLLALALLLFSGTIPRTSVPATVDV